MEDAQILAGFSFGSLPQNADAQIGPVTVNGAWIASSLVAGAQNRGADHTVGGSDDDLNFGNSDDVLYTVHNTATLSKIVSLTIKGTVTGTPTSISSNDDFGFVAQAFGAIKINGELVSLPAGISNLGETGDDSFHPFP